MLSCKSILTFTLWIDDLYENYIHISFPYIILLKIVMRLMSWLSFILILKLNEIWICFTYFVKITNVNRKEKLKNYKKYVWNLMYSICVQFQFNIDSHEKKKISDLIRNELRKFNWIEIIFGNKITYGIVSYDLVMLS